MAALEPVDGVGPDIPAVGPPVAGVERIRQRVLALLDDSTSTGTLTRRLERAGFTVDAVCSPAAALAAVARAAPDLVLLGAGVPYASGDMLLRRVLRRAQVTRPAVLQYRELYLDTEQRRARLRGRGINLTATETKLLGALIARSERLVSRAQLMARVRPRGGGGEDDNILEFFVSQLRRKLEAGGEARLIHTVRGAGYVLRET